MRQFELIRYDGSYCLTCIDTTRYDFVWGFRHLIRRLDHGLD